MENLKRSLAEHPFFADLSSHHLDTIVGCASNVRFNAGEFIFKEGESANRFYLIKYGKVSVETYVPSKGALTIDMVNEGEVLGWSWLFPPFRWHFDARALELTRAIALDGKCLRDKKENDHELGYVLMTFFAQIMESVLEATRMQLVDMYKNPEENRPYTR
jgi:CRP-like cAMP-binding protein